MAYKPSNYILYKELLNVAKKHIHYKSEPYRKLSTALFRELMSDNKKIKSTPELDYLYEDFLKLYKIDIKLRGRKREVVATRQFFFYQCRQMYGNKLTLVEIGKYLNNDHTTVIHSIRNITEKLAIKDELVTSLFNKWEKRKIT